MFRRLFSSINRQYIAEIAVIIVFALLATKEFQNFDTSYRLAGIETEYLTSSATWVSTIFQQSSYIPQWQPYLDSGQPVVDEAYSFIVNPFYSVPILLFGDPNGIKISIILHFAIAGVGGWFLGWLLGWKSLARMLIACLLILKGNMQGVVGMGFLQLGTTQAYFPWVFAGALAIIRYPRKRWTPVLLAVSIALLFLGGNLYNVLPALILVLLVILFYCVRVRSDFSKIDLDEDRLKRFVFAGLLTVGLTAVTALTVSLNYGLVRGHPDASFYQVGDPIMALWQFAASEPLFYGLFTENLYSYSIPLWFLAAIFLLLPPIPRLHQPASPEQGWRLWLLIFAGFILFFSWGIGINPILGWMYENLPFIGQWRFTERMMSVAAFLLIFLIGLRIDGLSRALEVSVNYKGKLKHLTKLLTGIILVATAGVAVMEVYQSRYPYDHLWESDMIVTPCVRWLRSEYPDEFLTVYRRDYGIVTPFVRNQVRLANIGAAYDLSGVDSTIYPYDLTNEWPEFFIPTWDERPEALRSLGYEAVENSPMLAADLDLHCVWHKQDALDFTFSVPLEQLKHATYPLPLEITTAVTYLGRTPERIWLEATPSPDQELVVVVQDVAYPGWIALVNGAPAEVQSVGQLLAVILPPGDQPQRVEFIFTAPMLKIGAVISLLTAFFSIGYLLQLDQLPHRLSSFNRAGLSSEKPVELERIPIPVPIPPIPIAPAPAPIIQNSVNVALKVSIFSFIKYLLYLFVTGIIGIIFLLLPAEARVPLFFLLVIASIGYGVYSGRKKTRSKSNETLSAYSLADLTPTEGMEATSPTSLPQISVTRPIISDSPGVNSIRRVPVAVQQVNTQNPGNEVFVAVLPSSANGNIHDIHGEPGTKSVRVVLPPSDVPYQIEPVQPSNNIRVNGMWAVITASVALLLLVLLARQPRKD